MPQRNPLANLYATRFVLAYYAQNNLQDNDPIIAQSRLGQYQNNPELKFVVQVFGFLPIFLNNQAILSCLVQIAVR